MTRSSRPVRLSVAMIVRDAEETIAASLSSIQAIADQIVLVDTGSVDNTCELARHHGAQVHQRPWQDSFAAARNVAWTLANGDWILWLDGNETLSADSAAAVRQWIDARADLACMYQLPVVVPAASSNTTGEQIFRSRLVPNRADLRFRGRVREHLHTSDPAGLPAVHTLPATCVIRRGQHDNDPRVKLTRCQRDLRLLEREIREQGQHPELLVALGEALSALGEQDGAVAAFRAAIGKSRPKSSAMLAAYYGLLAAANGDVSQREAQIQLCLEALERFPLDTQLLCAMGSYLVTLDRLPLAARAYQTAWEHGQVEPTLWHVADLREVAAICVALVLQMQGDDRDSQTALEAILQTNPDSLRARRHLIDLHIKHDRRREALAQFDLLPADLPHRDALRSAVRGASLAARKNWAAALAYLQSAHAAGCRDPLCLRWLSLALVATGQIEAAAPILAQWRSEDPRNIEAQKYLAALEAGTLGASSIDRIAGELEGRLLRVDANESLERPSPEVHARPQPFWRKTGQETTS